MWNVKKAIYDWWFKTFWMIGETRKTRNYKLWIVDIFDSESRYQLDVWLSFTTQLFILFINIPLKCKFTKTRDRLNIEKHRSDESRRIRNIIEKIKKTIKVKITARIPDWALTEVITWRKKNIEKARRVQRVRAICKQNT